MVKTVCGRTRKMRGKFITVEGCEGSGKSTQIELLREKLNNLGADYMIAREPGGTEISEKIRAIILDKNNSGMTDECEALLYAASRAQLLGEIVIPALKSGKTVVLDRYIDSSLAYQAYARGLGFDFVYKVNAFAFENAVPDCTLFLNIDPESAFRRKGGADAEDRVEAAGLEFHKKVYAGYIALAEKFPERFEVIDCKDSTRGQTHEKIMRALEKRGCL